MKIYNTLTRKKEEFKPIKKGKVGLYVCGPTVYDEPHIGHARSAYVFDVIRKYFEYKNYKVKFIRNITDVDDKIIKKAKQEFKIEKVDKKAVKQISQKYLDSYHECMEKLGISNPDKEPSAVKYISKMKKFIALLIKKNVAYTKDGDVYFDIKSSKNYGKLSGQNLEKMESSVRIVPGEKKRDPLDFALWKKAKEGEPSWKSPWGNGRPGWHIECSVMSSDLLGSEFDIHAGGIDLIFPHHENEIAQSEGAGNKFARYWMHNGLLTINGEKMAKSLGNFISIREFPKSLNLLKLLFLSSHYRHPVDYTEDKIESMRDSRDRILAFLQKVDNALKEYKKTIIADKEYENSFIAAMDDDFNTPVALSVIFRCVADGNKLLEKESLEKQDKAKLAGTRHFIKDVSKNIFGLNLDYSAQNTDIETMVNEREKARKAKDFKKADIIRNELLAQGIVVEDTKKGSVWRKKL
ncbi:MAG: cysteine--tRNA ligase [Candidatus Omnitrophica bacterium]|nr:cysteine--tRNA ligase [Candidatus Omnitrophota bacterium]